MYGVAASTVKKRQSFSPPGAGSPIFTQISHPNTPRGRRLLPVVAASYQLIVWRSRVEVSTKPSGTVADDGLFELETG